MRAVAAAIASASLSMPPRRPAALRRFMISALCPIFTAVLGAIFLRERPNRIQWLFSCVSILGVLLVSFGGSGGQNTVLGCVCLLGAYFSGSFYSLLVRRLSKDFSAFELTYIMFTVGFVFFLFLPFVQFGSSAAGMLAGALGHRDFVIAAIYLGAVSSVGAYMLANYSLARLPVARQSVFQNMSTVISVLSGVLIMGDAFTPVSLISFALILLGVWGVNRYAG